MEKDAERKAAAAATKSSSSKLVSEVSRGVEMADVYLRHPANESSTDSEGEEAPFDGGGDEERENDTFRKVLQQQRDMQVKRAQEAEAKKTTGDKSV